MGLFHIWHSFTDYSRILHVNWGFTWPTAAHCSEIYQKDSGASFQGDGIRYHVFSCKESTSIDQLFEWQSEQNETNYHDSFVDAVDDWLDEIEVPLAQRPDYNHAYSGMNHKQMAVKLLYFGIKINTISIRWNLFCEMG